MPDFRRLLETAANVVIIVAGVVVIVALIAVTLRERGPVPSDRPFQYEDGQKLPWPLVNQADPDALDVVLYLNTGCRFCRDNVEFHRELSRAVLAASSLARMFVITDEPVDRVSRYLADHNIRASVSPIGDTGLRLTGTPTIVLSKAGRVIGGWRGRLDQSRQLEILRLIHTRTGT
jgi:hypothetical protein